MYVQHFIIVTERKNLYQFSMHTTCLRIFTEAVVCIQKFDGIHCHNKNICSGCQTLDIVYINTGLPLN